jgi:hypothetical protein
MIAIGIFTIVTGWDLGFLISAMVMTEHHLTHAISLAWTPYRKFWYVNASGHTYVEGTGENAVTKTRINAFSDVQGTACSVEAFVERHRTLHEVLQHFEQPEDRSKFRFLCDCPAFWSSNSHCSHVVALYHYLQIIDVFKMMSALQPVRKRGRPTTREKALERDRDLEEGVKSVNPARWRKQLIRHSEYLTGFVYDTRAYEKKNRIVTVWKVRFPDAPGGMQDFEMESAELEEAIKLYNL